MIGYVAGVIDARGFIELRDKRNAPWARIRVTTKRTELIEYLAKLTGGTVRIDERGYERRPCSEHCAERHQHTVRQSPYWEVSGPRALIVLHNVLPELTYNRLAAIQALHDGALTYSVKRTEVTAQMKRLGWELPTREDVTLWRKEET